MVSTGSTTHRQPWAGSAGNMMAKRLPTATVTVSAGLLKAV